MRRHHFNMRLILTAIVAGTMWAAIIVIAVFA